MTIKYIIWSFGIFVPFWYICSDLATLVLEPKVVFLIRIGANAGAENWGTAGPRGSFGWSGTNGAVAGTGGAYGGGNGSQNSSRPHQGGNRKGYSAR
jgi:hypothetical protein